MDLFCYILLYDFYGKNVNLLGKFAAIRGIAGYLPPTVEHNIGTARMEDATGIESYHVVDEDMAASDIAVSACEAFFSRYEGKVSREDIDFILLCTQLPDYFFPTTACIVADRLGLKKSVGALDYNLGCSGYVYGLALAKSLIETGLAHRLLLITASNYTSVGNDLNQAMKPIFGDAATATLLEAVDAERPPLDAFVFGTDGSGYDGIIMEAGGSRFPAVRTPVRVIHDEHGEHTNYNGHMDGMKIMRFTLREVPPLVDAVLEKAGIGREDLDYCVFHQANKLVLEYVRKKCKLMDVPFYNNVRTVGNTIPSTIPLALLDVTKETSPDKLRRVMMAGFGVGLSWAGCIADLSHMMTI